MTLTTEINIGFSYANKRLLARVTFPSELAQALQDAGLNRAELLITDEGILLKPFKGDHKSHTKRKLELPQAWFGEEAKQEKTGGINDKLS